MAKRFTDSELWNKDWFLDLSIKQKLLVKYIFDNCDIAGFLEISFRTLSFVFGEKVTREDFEGLKQIKFINENTVFVEDFIKFQNNVEIEDLNPNYSVHKGIIKKLNKYNSFVTLKDPCQDLQCETSNGSLQVKVKVKDKVIVKNKEEEKKENLTKEKKEIPLENFDFVSKPIEPFCNSQIDDCIEIYKTTCTELCKLTGFERRDLKTRTKISEFLSAIGCDMEYYRRLCVEANRLKYIANSLIDISSMVNNHIGIMNGKYVKQVVENEQQSKFIKEYEKLLEL